MLGNCQRKDVGVVGAKLFYGDDTVQHVGIVVGLGGAAGHVLVGEKRDSLGYCAKCVIQQNYSAVTAACMMISRELFDKVGGFDEELTVAMNDVDLCLKARKEGLLVVMDPNIQLYHYESKSRGTEDQNMDAYKRFKVETEYMYDKWPEYYENGDPFYNENFTLLDSDFGLRKQ